jgi:outer membrane lipoprotein-sorting protein
MKYILQLVSLLVAAPIIAMAASAGLERIVPLGWVIEAEAHLARIDNYTAVFHKQERVKGDLRDEEVVFFKFKKPFKIYMKWIREPGKGREVLYANGWNQNQIKAHESWMKMGVTVDLDAKGFLAMRGSRHPITDSGLENFLRIMRRDLGNGMQSRELIYRDLGEETVYGSRCQRVEYFFPKEKSKGYYCYHAIINFDVKTKMPIRVRIYDWDESLVEDYGYESLKLDAGLTDADFDPKNPEYGFSPSDPKNPPLKTPPQ